MNSENLHSFLKRAGNSAVASNPTQNGKTAAIAVTSHGSDFYYAIMSVMGIVGIGTIIAGHMKPQRHRIFYYITAAINLTAMLAYYAMGSHQGWAPIDVEYLRSNSKVSGVNREIYYARYIDWYVAHKPDLEDYKSILTVIPFQVHHHATTSPGSHAHCWYAMAYNCVDHLHGLDHDHHRTHRRTYSQHLEVG